METYAIKNLSFRYPETGIDVLKDITFSVNEGEFITVCGPSGCGKSTLLRHLKPDLSPHGVLSGEIFFEEKPISDLSHREQSSKIGFVMQSPENQIVTDKVWHELAFGLESLGYDNNTIRKRVAETASFFGIQNYFEKSLSFRKTQYMSRLILTCFNRFNSASVNLGKISRIIYRKSYYCCGKRKI